MEPLLIREATVADVPAVLDIRNTAIRSSSALWTSTPATEAEILGWVETSLRGDAPLLVADDGAGAIAYASYGPWRSKCGYRRTVEDSIYVAEGQQGRGIGRALLAALVARARTAGMHVMVADIESGNLASIGLHAAAGFTTVGELQEVGTKFGRWLDLTIMTLRLQDDLPPEA